jgi:hypothetical protein
MNASKSFSYVFDDESWLSKILIGGVLSVIPIANFIPSGYTLELFRNVVNGSDSPLPEWSDLGQKFGQGLLLFVIGFIYNLPIFLLTSCVWMGVGFLDRGAQGDDIRGFASLVQWCLATPYGLLMAVVWPGVFSQFAISGDVASAFNFRQIVGMMRENLSDYAIVVLLTVALRIISGFGLILCCVGVLFVGFWASLVKTHLYAELYMSTQRDAIEVMEG